MTRTETAEDTPKKGARMRGGWKKQVWLVSAVTLLAVGCGASAAHPPTASMVKAAFPTGKFTNGNWSLDFKGDGNYIASGPPGSETGTYRVTGNLVVITCQCCGEVTGNYTWIYDGKTLTFTAIEDKCSNRLGVVAAGQWLKTP